MPGKSSLDNCRLPIANCRLVNYSGQPCAFQQSEIGNRQSAMPLVRLLAVVWCGFDPARHFSLAFFLLIGFLAGVDRGSHGTGLSRRGFASSLGHLTNLLGSL